MTPRDYDDLIAGYDRLIDGYDKLIRECDRAVYVLVAPLVVLALSIGIALLVVVFR